MLMADAKPSWSALYHSLTLTDREDYEYRTGSIYKDIARCIGLRIRGKLLKVNDLVAREGVEPPTPAFSGLRTTNLSPCPVNNLTDQGGRFIVTTP
jgi:hypothetical protein